MHTYIKSEPSLWTVGHYDPSGKWVPESDHDSSEEAARRVHMLNGGSNARLLALLRRVHSGGPQGVTGEALREEIGLAIKQAEGR